MYTLHIHFLDIKRISKLFLTLIVHLFYVKQMHISGVCFVFYCCIVEVSSNYNRKYKFPCLVLSLKPSSACSCLQIQMEFIAIQNELVGPKDQDPQWKSIILDPLSYIPQLKKSYTDLPKLRIWPKFLKHFLTFKTRKQFSYHLIGALQMGWEGLLMCTQQKVEWRNIQCRQQKKENGFQYL